jgi:murein DD-endopeptidase MepM/ murein hydrolase activator NlpD
MTSVYAHLSKINVKKDEIIRKGYQIGNVGSTGAVTGPHLHFEIRKNGIATNPFDFIKK